SVSTWTVNNLYAERNMSGRVFWDVVRNPGMISDETICGVQSFHRIVFGDVSDAYQFFPSPSRISDNPDYRTNLQHGWITDIYYK
ncbi:MAG TPA: hypothetical protein VF051_01030, partial [Hyphomicrobiaceae bacterium]